ncbi:putative 4-coumarate--CoA ligase 1 isoform X2 [Amblyomma americanum]
MQRYAVGFRQHGVLPGDRMCVHLKNSVENLIAICGCILSGATIVLAKTSLSEGELRYIAQDSDSAHILCDEEYTEKVPKAVANLPMKGLFCMGHAAGFVAASTFSTLDEEEFKESPVTDPRSTVLAVCYTSGSTGMPKGAEVTHYNYVSSFYTTRLQAPWGENDVLLVFSPITHMSGLLLNTAGLLDGSTCVVIPTRMDPLDIMDAVDKYKATAAFFFPRQLQATVREMQRTGRCLPSVRGVAVSGSVLPTPVADAARKALVGIENLLHVYGMTEAFGIITGQGRTGKPHTGNDVGVPGMSLVVKVVDVETGEKLGPQQTGEICFRGPSVVRGYYKRPTETANLFDKEGWCKSGDAGYYDEDGRFYIVERLKQMIKCMDNQVVPGELEELLLREHAAEIAEVCVVGLPHGQLGEAPTAAVVLTEEGSRRNGQQLSESIKDIVQRNLAVHKHLHGGVFFVDSLPRTDTAKVNRPALVRSLMAAQQGVTK